MQSNFVFLLQHHLERGTSLFNAGPVTWKVKIVTNRPGLETQHAATVTDLD